MQADQESIDRLIEQLRNVGSTPPPPVPPLPPSGGGGTSGGMEGRVAKLEAHVETLRTDVGMVRKDVGDIRVHIATMLERLAHVPSRGFVVTATTTSIGLLTAVIVFGDRIRTILGLS